MIIQSIFSLQRSVIFVFQPRMVLYIDEKFEHIEHSDYSGQTEHLIPEQTEHPIPEQTEHPIPVQSEHPIPEQSEHPILG